jgi:hypothetical protein
MEMEYGFSRQYVELQLVDFMDKSQSFKYLVAPRL